MDEKPILISIHHTTLFQLRKAAEWWCLEHQQDPQYREVVQAIVKAEIAQDLAYKSFKFSGANPRSNDM